MNFNSKKTSLLISGITSIVLSRAMFAFFNDPEGPNLLVVFVMAAIVYGLSFGIYRLLPLTKQEGVKKLLSLVLIQIVIIVGLYSCLK